MAARWLVPVHGTYEVLHHVTHNRQPHFSSLRLIRIYKVYYGRPSGLPGYCTDLGKAPPLYSNIAEFFLEVVDEYEAADRVEVNFYLQNGLMLVFRCASHGDIVM